MVSKQALLDPDKREMMRRNKLIQCNFNKYLFGKK